MKWNKELVRLEKAAKCQTITSNKIINKKQEYTKQTNKQKNLLSYLPSLLFTRLLSHRGNVICNVSFRTV